MNMPRFITEGMIVGALLTCATILPAGEGKPAGPARFKRHDIDSFPGGYQVAVADLNGDGKLDVIALSTDANRVDWYENPGWKRRPVARTERNIDVAPHDIDGDGRPELALASGFYFSESSKGGEIQLLRRSDNLEDTWVPQPIAVDPVVHRLRWGDLDGDGRAELVHAPIFGPGSKGAKEPKPAHLWAFRAPAKPGDAWETWKIDETLTVLHGLYVGDLDNDGRDEILTAAFEGIHRFDYEDIKPRPAVAPHTKPRPAVAPGGAPEGRWQKVHISAGAKPANDKPGTARGSSEVVPGRLGPDRPFLAAIEPWHGNQVVVYRPDGNGGWRRQVLDDTLNQGHALVVADFDRDGADEIVAGWRGGKGGLALYDPTGDGNRFTKVPIDRGITVQGAVAADINRDGKLDLAVIAGRSNNLVWYGGR